MRFRAAAAALAVLCFFGCGVDGPPPSMVLWVVDPVIVVIADRGEEFGEHGRFGHLSLYREVLDVPFLIHLPGQIEGRRVDVPVQQADIVPTLVDLAGGEIAEEVDGPSLVPLLRGSCGGPSSRRSNPTKSRSTKIRAGN